MDTDLSHSALNRFEQLEQAVSRLFHNGGVHRQEDESVQEHIARATNEDVSVNPPTPAPVVTTEPETDVVPPKDTEPVAPEVTP